MSLPSALQPHFDGLPLDQQIDLVQELWQRIASHASLPVPPWHLAELKQREREPRETRPDSTWEAVREQLMRRLDGA